MWYRTGTVTVTNGSAVVAGAGTNFVDNVSVGEIFVGPDLRVYEIVQVVSATDLRISPVYQAGNAGGQGYAIAPTQSFARDLALSAAALLNTFAVVRDGVGQGLFSAGSVATPGIRFLADQDTGVRLRNANEMAFTCGGADRGYVNADGFGINGSIDVAGGNYVASNIYDNFAVGSARIAHYGMTVKAVLFGENPGLAMSGFGGLAFFTGGTERARIDVNGNMLVGNASQTNFHRFNKDVAQGLPIFEVARFGRAGFAVYSSEGGYGSSAGCTVTTGSNTTTGRSINAGGTINASGADYAEYMLKADGCGPIAKGDVCGVDRDGRLTKTWAEAVSFVIKSTDPSLVGGDTWDADVGPKPEEPGAEPVEPSMPAPPAEDADDATLDAWRNAMAAYRAQIASYQAARAEWQKATDAYAKALPIWEAAHEKARQCVDRIAFCGQVPANVTGDFEVGDYIIAAAAGAGIKAVAVKADDMTLPQYMRRIGKVWAIRDGRAWIDVQHG
ncbi:hypothetical protein [Sphingomonas carotinifaciens]|uniref:hypothetical protein n=1 Tax=Sphingomonas carotinifaciens TaxID=1166323 RepID=UPI000DDB1106|nr:hypothetical protein [Sphingomonas carotinifaciens]